MKNYITILFLILALNVFSQENEVYRKKIDFIFINVNIKGNNYKFLFDTGAFTTVFYDIENVVKTDKNQSVNMINSMKDIDTTYSFPKKDIPFELADYDIKIKGINKFIISKDIPKEFKDYNIRGVLGNNIISKFDWYYDFANNKLVICKDKRNIDKSEYVSITFDNVYRTECELITDKNCSLYDKYLIDTGYSDILFHSKVDCYKDYINYKSKIVTIAKNIDITDEKIIKTDLEFGNLKITGIPVNISDIINSDNLLGIKFLKSFEKIYFLFSENKMLLKKQKKYTFTLTSPSVYDGKIYSFLENPSNLNHFKKWDIGKEVKLENKDFDSIEYPVEFTEIIK
jgi:hypothetical protein